VKFYFDGCSFTYGGELKRKCGVNPEDVRWSRLVCDHFGAEEINLSCGGAANDTIMRHLFDKTPNEVYDFYFFQTTYPFRQEFYDTIHKRWNRFKFIEDIDKNPLFYKKYVKRWGLVETKKFEEWIRFGYKKIYSDQYAKTKENITYNALKSYVASVGQEKKTFFSTLLRPRQTDNKYDLYLHMESKFFDRIPNDGHPNIKGHKTIANYVIDFVSERL